MRNSSIPTYALLAFFTGSVISTNSFALSIEVNTDASVEGNDDVVCVLDRVIEYKGKYHYYFKCSDGHEALIRDRPTRDEWKIGQEISRTGGKWKIH